VAPRGEKSSGEPRHRGEKTSDVAPRGEKSSGEPRQTGKMPDLGAKQKPEVAAGGTPAVPCGGREQPAQR